MKIFLGQIYIEVGVNYPFTHHFQRYISQELTDQTVPSKKFIDKYAEDFELTFNMSAKANITESEVRGPAVYKQDKDVEYTIFLPFNQFDKDVLPHLDLYRQVLAELIDQIVIVLESLEIDVLQIRQATNEIIEKIVTTPKMLNRPTD